MQYNVYDYSDESKQILENFERDLQQKIKNLLKADYNWKCVMKLSLNRREGDIGICSYSSNPSLDMVNTYDVSNKIKDFFKKQIDVIKPKISENHNLSLNLNFVTLTPEEIEKRQDTSMKKETNSSSSCSETEDVTFLAINPNYALEDVIIPDNLKNDILYSINILKYQDLIYNDWGFNRVDPVPKSVLNFYGPPGTGKTMCAHGIAQQLNKKLLALNYAEIESKYVGEAPKNLMKAFNTARQNDAVLFFDEADSFLGKRIQNVSHGAEQALNSLRSQMLMLLEQHPGVIIFATNLVSNFDSAFESRILKHLKFELPNKEARCKIIQNMIPARLPWENMMTETQLEGLSDIAEGLSGREIKNVILETMLNKVSESGANARFDSEDFKSCFVRKQEEKKKLKEEADARLKEKITNALKKQADNIPSDTHSTETTSTENVIDTTPIENNAVKE